MSPSDKWSVLGHHAAVGPLLNELASLACLIREGALGTAFTHRQLRGSISASDALGSPLMKGASEESSNRSLYWRQ